MLASVCFIAFYCGREKFLKDVRKESRPRREGGRVFQDTPASFGRRGLWLTLTEANRGPREASKGSGQATLMGCDTWRRWSSISVPRRYSHHYPYGSSLRSAEPPAVPGLYRRRRCLRLRFMELAGQRARPLAAGFEPVTSEGAPPPRRTVLLPDQQLHQMLAQKRSRARPHARWQ